MSIIGKWKVAYAAGFDESGLKWLNQEEYRAANIADIDEAEKTLGTLFEFAEDGRLLYCVKIPAEAPQEQIDEAVKAGEIKVKDGYMYNEQQWKEENGKYFYNSEIQGEAFGEAVSPWVELNIESDGTLNFMNMLRLERI